MGGQQLAGLGCAAILASYICHPWQNPIKYTHLSMLATNMLYASEEHRAVSRKCLQSRKSSVNDGNKMKELSSLNIVEIEGSHQGAPNVLHSFFLKCITFFLFWYH